MWRRPPKGATQRNYYIIVEPIAPDGRKLKLPIRNEETGETQEVDRFGVRVPQATFDAVAADKRDDGIVQKNRFGVKRRGTLAVDYHDAVRRRHDHEVVARQTMWTGRQTLGEIEGALAKLRRDEGQLDGALASAAEPGRASAARPRRRLARAGRVKLDEMAAGRLVRNLDAAEQRALQILESRRLRLEAVNAQRQTGHHRGRAGRSRPQRGRRGRRARARGGRGDPRRAPRHVTSAHRAWVDARKAFEAGDSIARRGGEARRARSESELGEKKKHYDGDPLFAYLWSNGFGTQRYHGRQHCALARSA